MSRPLALAIPILLLSCGPEATEEPGATPMSAAPTPDPVRPNVLIITLDTTRADVLAPYGGRAAATPTAARLASEGVVFDRAYTPTPLTIPAHTSLFTGQYPPRHGVRDNGDFFLSEGATTLAEHLHGVGYQTMASVGAEVTSHHWGFAQGFDAYFDDMGDARDQNRWRVERPGADVVDDALQWLETHASQDGPWMSWIHLFDAHHPYAPPEPFASRFVGRPYLGEVASADAQIGRILTLLEAQGELAHTWVIMTADHGEGLGSHGENLHGVLLYDATTRVPLIIRPPAGLETPRRVSQTVSLVDLAPTVLSLAGIPPAENMEGIDLSPWLQTAAPDPPPAERSVYLESLYAWHHFGWAPQRALVDGQSKLIDSTTAELYHRADSREADNRAEAEPDRVHALQAALDAMQIPDSGDGNQVQEAQLSAEQIMQLEALGYMTGESSTAGEAIPFRGSLPDPVSRLPVLAQVESARLALQTGDLETAAERVEQVLELEPGLVTVRSLQVQILVRQGKLETALRLARALHAERPTSNTRTALGYLFLMQGELEQAARFFSEALEADPYLESCWRGYLHILFIRGEILTLREQIDRAQALLPSSPTIQGMDGVVLAMTGQHEAAESSLLAAIEVLPRQPFLHHGMGIIRKQQGRLDEAEDFFLDELQIQPPALPSRKLLVEIYAAQGRYAEQLEQLEIIVDVEPPHLLTAHSKAQALYNLERFDEAEGAIEICRRLAPTYPACAMLEANILKRLGREQDAQKAYEHALELRAQMESSETESLLPLRDSRDP